MYPGETYARSADFRGCFHVGWKAYRQKEEKEERRFAMRRKVGAAGYRYGYGIQVIENFLPILPPPPAV